MAPGDRDGGQARSGGTSVEIERLRRENEQLRVDLEVCKDQLFELLEKENDVPEHDIKVSFNRILTGIESWIDEAASEKDFEAVFKANYQRNMNGNNAKKSFADLGLDRLLYTDARWLMSLENWDSCHLVIISLVISRFLIQEIFRQQMYNELGNLYPYGISDNDIRLMVRIQKAMGDNLLRDDSDISRWRGQAVSALLTEADIKITADKESSKHLEKLKQILEQWIGAITGQLWEHLMTNVISRAMETLNMLCRSHRTYAIGNPPISLGPIREKEKLWPVREISSWKKIQPSNVTVLLHCLYPGVLRMGESGQEDVLIVPPTLLGYNGPETLPPLPSPSSSAASRSTSPRKKEAKKGEHEGHDNAASRASHRQSSSTQGLRPARQMLQKTKTSASYNDFLSFWKPPRQASSKNVPGASSSARHGQHSSPQSPMSETYPVAHAPYNQYPGETQGSGMDPLNFYGDANTAEYPYASLPNRPNQTGTQQDYPWTDFATHKSKTWK